MTCTASRSAATRSPPRVALKNIEIMEREDVIENVRANEGYFQDALHGLMARHEIVGDVRGAGYFRPWSWSRTGPRGETFTPRSATVLLRDFLSPRSWRRA